eukprot:COSAG02_NODE_44676_length_364_cov_0.641509_1_plen_87_part_01
MTRLAFRSLFTPASAKYLSLEDWRGGERRQHAVCIVPISPIRADLPGLCERYLCWKALGQPIAHRCQPLAPANHSKELSAFSHISPT